MMKHILLGTCAVLLLAGIATAQTATTNPPPPPPAQDQQAKGPDDQAGGWFNGRRHGHHGGQMGRHGMGRPGMSGPGLRMEGKGFGIMVGRGHALHVNCGDEAIKDCIAAAQPLIDALGKLDFKMPSPPAQ